MILDHDLDLGRRLNLIIEKTEDSTAALFSLPTGGRF